MAPHISQNLSTIKTTAKELNALADMATEQIHALDKFLAEHNPGVEVWAATDFAGGTRKNRKEHMVDAWHNVGYARDEDGRWGLVIQCYGNQTTADGNPLDPLEYDYEVFWRRPLSSASRDLRVAAMPYLSEVIEKLAAKMRETVDALKKDVASVKAVAEELHAALQDKANDEQPTTIEGELRKDRAIAGKWRK